MTNPTPDLPAFVPSVGGPTTPTSVIEPSIAPHTVLVAVGATVTWNNDVDVDYSLASDDGWIDVAVAAGETFTW